MKKFILALALCFATGSLCAQEIGEPEFVGETVVVRENGESHLLEKSTVLLRTRVNASAIIFGIGKAKTVIMVDGTTAATQLRADENFRFIIKAVDNRTDPMSIVQIFRFAANKKQRTRASTWMWCVCPWTRRLLPVETKVLAGGCKKAKWVVYFVETNGRIRKE